MEVMDISMNVRIRKVSAEKTQSKSGMAAGCHGSVTKWVRVQAEKVGLAYVSQTTTSISVLMKQCRNPKVGLAGAPLSDKPDLFAVT